jgi:GNAT superfamily N-acetyltransferase
MMDSKALIQATLGAGREFFQAPSSHADSGHAAAVAADQHGEKQERALPHLVPMRALSPRHRKRIAQHLLALQPQDRYLRFGYAAQDANIQSYVDSLNFARDEIYGIYNRSLTLIAVAHLALSAESTCLNCAEFGVSVNHDARGKGYGTLLFGRAMTHARNQGVSMMFIQALSENAAMLKIATNAGARVERHGSESEAYLSLPPANLDSRFTEAVEDRVGEVDFQLKWQAKRFWQWLGQLQGIRQGVRDARGQSAQ